MTNITVMLVEDDVTTANNVADLINDQPDMKMVGVTYDPKKALADIERLLPMIVLIDISITPDNRQQGIELALEASLRFQESIKVIMLSQTMDEESIYNTIGVGAAFNYVTKDRIELLPLILQAAADDKRLLEPMVAQSLIQAFQISVRATMESAVTDHELDVLEHVYEGYSNSEIADKFNLERQSLTNAKAKIVRKLTKHFTWHKSPKKLTAQELARRYKKAGFFVTVFCLMLNTHLPPI